MKKFLLFGSFFTGIPTLLLASFYLLTHPALITRHIPLVLSASIDSALEFLPSISLISISSSDARPAIVKNYLHRYNSPLEPYSQFLVTTADKYYLDYRLLPAIAQQESNLCKKIPENSHNCWGFGIYGDNVIRFDSYPQAIEIVAKTLKRDYIDQGLDTPEEIMAKYTPPSIEKGGPWAKAVSRFLSDLE